MLEQRHRYSPEFRAQMVALTLEPGASVSRVALEHDLNTNLLFKWRRKILRERAIARLKSPALLPVTVTPGETLALEPATKAPEAVGAIEVIVPGGRIRLSGPVDGQALRTVLRVLAER